MLARGKLQFSPLLQTRVSGITGNATCICGTVQFPQIQPALYFKGAIRRGTSSLN